VNLMLRQPNLGLAHAHAADNPANQGDEFANLSLQAAWGQLLGASGLLTLPQGRSAAAAWLERATIGSSVRSPSLLSFRELYNVAMSVERNARQA